MCAGFEAGIEGSTHAVEQRRLKMLRQRQRGEESRIPADEEETESMYTVFDHINVETAGTGKEVVEDLNAALGMDI